MDYTVYYIAIPIIVAIAAIGYFIFWKWKTNRPTNPIAIVPEGWQFFPKLTQGDTPGTIFRITSQKQKFTVGITKNTLIHSYPEAQGKMTQKIEANTDMLAKVLGINLEAGIVASQNEEITFEMPDSIKEVTYDTEIHPLIKKELAGITPMQGDRYFVIRDTSKTQQINFELKRDQVDRLGGEAKIQEKIEVKSTVFNKKDSTTYELKRSFPEPMRVMFNAEEISWKNFEQEREFPSRPQLPREYIFKPVKELLDWIVEQ